MGWRAGEEGAEIGEGPREMRDGEWAREVGGVTGSSSVRTRIVKRGGTLMDGGAKEEYGDGERDEWRAAESDGGEG